MFKWGNEMRFCFSAQITKPDPWTQLHQTNLEHQNPQIPRTCGYDWQFHTNPKISNPKSNPAQRGTELSYLLCLYFFAIPIFCPSLKPSGMIFFLNIFQICSLTLNFMLDRIHSQGASSQILQNLGTGMFICFLCGAVELWFDIWFCSLLG